MSWRHKVLRVLSGAAKEQHHHLRVIHANTVKARNTRRKVKDYDTKKQASFQARSTAHAQATARRASEKQQRDAERERAKAAKKNAKARDKYYKGRPYDDPIPF